MLGARALFDWSEWFSQAHLHKIDDNAVEIIYYNFTKMNMSCVFSSCKCGRIIRPSFLWRREAQELFHLFSPPPHTFWVCPDEKDHFCLCVQRALRALTHPSAPAGDIAADRQTRANAYSNAPRNTSQLCNWAPSINHSSELLYWLAKEPRKLPTSAGASREPGFTCWNLGSIGLYRVV